MKTCAKHSITHNHARCPECRREARQAHPERSKRDAEVKRARRSCLSVVRIVPCQDCGIEMRLEKRSHRTRCHECAKKREQEYWRVRHAQKRIETATKKAKPIVGKKVRAKGTSKRGEGVHSIGPVHGITDAMRKVIIAAYLGGDEYEKALIKSRNPDIVFP